MAVMRVPVCIIFKHVVSNGKDIDASTVTCTYTIWLSLYSASQKKRNREVSMFYHNLITTIINE